MSTNANVRTVRNVRDQLTRSRKFEEEVEKSKRETHADASNRCDAIECDVAIKTFQRLRHRFGKFAGVEVSSQFTYPIGPVHLNWI